MTKTIHVTRPFLPPLEEFTGLLKELWESRFLTNQGKFHAQFEEQLAAYLGVPHISLFANGTLALVTALQALRLTGEVITTPFSFVATTHSLWWNNIKPVFVDIEPDTFNLDPERIESAITPQTAAILPVHVFGYPCAVERIRDIADTYGLKVLYDACHAFGVRLNGVPVLNFGDLSVLSFHATKVFTTFEGGAIIARDEATKRRIDFLKNFGFANETTVVAPGINAKMNEFQAALGLLQLKYVDDAIARRGERSAYYRTLLAGTEGIRYLDDIPGVKHAYPYFPILVDKEKAGRSRDEVFKALREKNIAARRYFYPLISQFPSYKGLESAKPVNLPVAERVTEQVICLPLYPDLDPADQETIVQIVRGR